MDEATPTEAPAEQPVPASDAVKANGASDPNANKSSDILERIRTEPEFAVEQFRKVQSAATKAQQELKALDPVKRVVEFVGSGDTAAGAQAAQQHLVTYSQLLNDPNMKRVIERYQQTGRAPGVDDFDTGLDDEPDPRDVELQSLKETVTRLTSSHAETKVHDAVRQFYATDEGKVLNEEERADLSGFVSGQIQNWSRSPQGQALLKDLNADTIQTIVDRWIRTNGKLGEIGERIHLAKIEKRKAGTTEVPGQSVPSANTEQDLDSAPLSKIVEWAMANPDKI